MYPRSRTPRPRPILKQDSSESSSSDSDPPFPFATCSTAAVYSPHVHFPPTPQLSCAHTTYSSNQYDRAPIQVSPNICALPGRNERDYRGRKTPNARGSEQPKGSYFHPLAYEACNLEPLDVPPLAFDPPPLILDASSESDDSPVTTPPDPRAVSMTPRTFHQFAHFSSGPRSPPIYRPSITPQEPVDLDNALRFLPHPPSPPEERSRRKRSSTPGPKHRRPAKPADAGSFASPTLDGCLGGF